MITIDNDLRTINIPSDTKLLGVVGDKDVNRLEIEMPAYYKDIDLSSYAVKINFRNVERGGLRHIEGKYIPVDKVSTGKIINFSWLVGEDACRYVGITEFSICLSNEESKDFNTRWAALPVLKRQLPPTGCSKDSETLELDVKGLEFEVDGETLIVKRKEEK